MYYTAFWHFNGTPDRLSRWTGRVVVGKHRPGSTLPYFFVVGLVHSICSGDSDAGLIGRPCFVRPDRGRPSWSLVTKPVIDPLVNGLKLLVKSTLTREMTGTTDTDLQSKFQRFQCGQVPLRFPTGTRCAASGGYEKLVFCHARVGLHVFLFVVFCLLAGRCSVAKRILSGNVPSQMWAWLQKSATSAGKTVGGNVWTSVRGIRPVLHNLAWTFDIVLWREKNDDVRRRCRRRKCRTGKRAALFETDTFPPPPPPPPPPVSSRLSIWPKSRLHCFIHVRTVCVHSCPPAQGFSAAGI